MVFLSMRGYSDHVTKFRPALAMLVCCISVSVNVVIGLLCVTTVDASCIRSVHSI